MNRYNHEGYPDPTAAEALANVERDEKAAKPYLPLVYIASPFSGDVAVNIERAKDYCKFAVGKGTIPLAPHLLYPRFLDDGDAKQRASLGFDSPLYCSANATSCGCSAIRRRRVWLAKSPKPRSAVCLYIISTKNARRSALMRNLKIAYGNSCFAKKWSNKEISFDDLCERLKTTVRTSESAEEYPKLPKADRDRAKDIGGFVGGSLKGGRRKRETVERRSMLTLDIDHADADFLGNYETLSVNAACIYSTRGHTPDAPRLRLIVPLARDVSPDEYNAIARFFASEWGIDQFDECSYRPHQLMYWPSTPSNGEFIFKAFAGDWLDPDIILAAHPNWRDCSLLPTSKRGSAATAHTAAMQQDPTTKDGVVGAFCRAYPIEDAITAFLSDVYEPSTIAGRYDYIPADSGAGVVLYDGKWAYSHHATDPACGKLLNAFDLMRVHKYGDLDDKASFKAMSGFAVSDEKVKAQFAEERRSGAKTEFDDGDDWQTALELEKNGAVKDTLDNLVLIIENDPKLAGIAYNELKSSLDFTAMPAWEPIKYPTWTDNDNSQLRGYISDVYGVYSPSKTQDALNMAAAKRRHHPIHDYLNGLPPWDGIPSVDTLLIDYLGAEDPGYTRAVTRKTIVAAVARVFAPGIKFDSILVMDGPQDKGKSTLFNRLAGDEWFNDGLTLTDMQDKSGA